MTHQYLLFDLDGTLTYPALGITNSILYALREMGVEPPERESLYQFIGPPLAKTFLEFFPEEKVQEAIDTYRVYFRAKGMFENTVYDGIPELLRELKARKIPAAVATSKPEEFAVTILEHFGLAEYFTVIGGASMDGSRGEKQQVIEYVLNKLDNGTSEFDISARKCQVSRSEYLMIGDRKYDMEGAKAFGMTALGVSWGYGTREELTEAGADMIADTPAELLDRITELTI